MRTASKCQKGLPLARCSTKEVEDARTTLGHHKDPPPACCCMRGMWRMREWCRDAIQLALMCERGGDVRTASKCHKDPPPACCCMRGRWRRTCFPGSVHQSI